MSTQLSRLALVLPIVLLALSSASMAQNDDVAFANWGPANDYCLNDGSSIFTCRVTSGEIRRTRAVVAKDMNKDGIDDLVFATGTTFSNPSGINLVCLNDGNGNFPCLIEVSQDTNNSQDLVVVDLDGDSDLDLAFANSGEVNRVCLDTGNLTYSCSDVSANADQTTGVAAADVDVDGDIDLIFANRLFPGGLANSLCLNNGDGTFTCSDISTDAKDADLSIGVTVANLDSDNDQDLVFSNSLGTDRACLNDGAGVFTCQDISPDTGDSRHSAAGDFDGDGDMDLACANSTGNDTSRRNKICLNDGSANFTCGDLDDNTDYSGDIAAADLDGDGDLDLVVANDDFWINVGTGFNLVCLNDGSAVFTCSNISTLEVATYGVAIGNFDGVAVTGIESDPDPLDTPDSFSVFPNPAAQNVNIVGPINESVVVYNVLGRTAASARTDYSGSATLDVSEFSPGVYILRMGTVTKVLTVL